MISVHEWLISVHAAAGMICFAAGALSMRPRASGSGWPRGFLASLVVMVLALAVVVGLDWSSLGTVTRLVYAALLGLAVYMLWRGSRALWLAWQRPAGWTRRYLDHVGFVLISLFDGFVVVAAIDLGAPGWLVGAIAAAGVAAGIALVNHAKARAVTR